MAATPGTTVSSPITVGRDFELEQLGAVIDDTRHGQGHVVVIGGEAGIGKSRLIDEALVRAGDSIRVLRGDCLALGTEIPYLPFAEMLRGLVRELSPQEIASIVGPARHELARLMPELEVGAANQTRVASTRTMGGDLERLRLYETMLRVAERIGDDRPTVFVIEDMQWMDSASLDLLAFLAHGLQRGPTSLVGSVRSEAMEGGNPVLQFLAALERSSDVQRIELGPLDSAATREQIAAILDKQPIDGLADRIHGLADGSPLFAEELLAASERSSSNGDLPPKLRDLLSARLTELSDDTLAVLRVAAAAGRTLDQRLMAVAAGLPDEDVETAVREAVDAHVLVRVETDLGPTYRFRHEIMRAEVASQLLPTEAARIHAAYAETLCAEPVERQIASEIAVHWDGSGVAEEALPARVRAAQVAADAFAFEQAYEHYERALALWSAVPDPESLVGTTRQDIAGYAATAAGRAGALDRAIELTRERITDREGMEASVYEQARSSLRWYLWESGRPDAAMDEARIVLDDSAVDEVWRANALAHLAGLLTTDQQTKEGQKLATEAMALARSADAHEEEILAEGVLGWCLVLEGDADAGIETIASALEAARKLDSTDPEGRYPVGLALAHAQLAAALELVGRLDEAHDTALAGIEVARTQGVARTYGSLLEAYAARTRYQLGRWDDAASEVDDAMSRGPVGAGRVALLAVRASIAVARGEAAQAAASLGEAESLSNDRTPLDVRRSLAAATAEQALWAGQPMVALTRLAVLQDEADEPNAGGIGGRPSMLDASVPRLVALAARAVADLALEERAAGLEAGLSTAASEQVAATMKRIVRRKVLSAAWASEIALARAELERADSGGAGTPRRWKAALDAAGARPYAAAYAGWRLAESHLSQRDGRDAAASIIGTALELSQRLGARPLADELRGLARRAGLATEESADGVVVEARGTNQPFGLTTREVEVLSLLATGMSNQEIADELFISPKTASVHVSNIYGKLGVESRVAAATTAHNLGLAGAPDEQA